MDDVSKIHSCIKLIKQLPVSKIEDNINAVSNLIYEEDDLLNEFLQKVDNRAEVCRDDKLGEFLMCEYNREEDSYRSPLSNKYFPELKGPTYPSESMRNLEIKFNKMFQNYSRVYYSPAALSSVYLWELGESLEEGFAVAVLIKNNVNLEKEVNSGVWDSINVVNVSFKNDGEKLKVNYQLTTSVILSMEFNNKICGNVNLSGTMSRQVLSL